MQDSSQGKMFLSAERGHTETDWFRSYCHFNFGRYQHPDKSAFGPLYVLNDETLPAGRNINFLVEEDTLIVLLPVVGAVTYSHNDEVIGTVQAGETVSLVMAANDTISFLNPFEEDLVNYLHVWFKLTNNINLAQPITEFSIDDHQNKLIPFFDAKANEPGDSFKGYIGKFSGREEIVYPLSQPGNRIFVFVIQGAFEVQYRLLEARDGLALWNTDEVEIEALSNEAIIVLAELPSSSITQ